MNKGACLSFRVRNVSKDEADIYIYDVIGDPWGEGTNASEFVRELRDLDVERINLHVNSPGGYVNDAIAIYNAIQGHRATVTAYIEGSADSAASFVVQAADKRVIAKNASMTIHEGHALAFGHAEAMRRLADRLDEESNNIASIYAERAGGTTEEWRGRMRANGGTEGTKYRGEQAVDAGLADEVGVATRNLLERRAAALMQPTNQDTPGDSSAIAAALKRALPAAKREPARPTLQQLLEDNPMKQAMSAALGGRGGK